jgi:hypothetical protein
LRVIGLAIEKDFTCPFNQCVLADALGLGPIHVNQVPRRLRAPTSTLWRVADDNDPLLPNRVAVLLA